MTNPETINQKKAQRMLQLFATARQRYLEAGGNPNHSANKQWMTEEEREEFVNLGEQIFDEEYIKKSLEQKNQPSL
ncbi:MAG: hypothetical protein MUD14_24870 [Hydrococcus sp. Prado102]|jgi:hypothetical protein|nr:hypothetical protein [Hydrococcus sp. Prado102]